MCYQDAIEKRKKRENYERKDENKRMRKNINNEKKNSKNINNEKKLRIC